MQEALFLLPLLSFLFLFVVVLLLLLLFLLLLFLLVPLLLACDFLVLTSPFKNKFIVR